MQKPTIKIDIVSDVVCPWCYVGKRRLEQALTKLSGQYHFELEYHPFELNPDMPPEGKNQAEYLGKKFGSESRYQEIISHMTQVAAQEGLDFHFEKQQVSPNTRNAHRLVQFAKSTGDNHLDLVEALFKAYFTDGVDLSKKENLVEVAVQAGMDRDTVEQILATDNGLKEVALAEKEMQQLGITGVPFYILNNKYGVSGAQPAETFVKALEQIGSEVNLTGESCNVDGGNC